MNEQIETWAGQCQWAVRNLAFNLDFVPDDKLNWKPAPTAKTALEIAGEVIGVFDFVAARLQNPEEAGGHDESPAPATREEAKQKVVAAADEYCRVLRGLDAASLKNTIEMPFGKVTLAFLAAMPVIDAIHHHGQIAYIQTLLGDTQSHFDFSLINL